MRWLKVAAILAGVMIAFLVVSSIVGFVLEAVIVVLAVAAVALGVKAAFSRKQVSRKRANREVRGPAYGRPRGRHNASDVDEELDRLKRETGS
jgi:hypothetical protein